MTNIEDDTHSPSRPQRVKTVGAATHLGLSPATLETDRSTGRLGIPYYKVGRAIIYDLMELDEWLASRRRCVEAA